MLEILAPAGNAACADAAIRSGADAIYLGYSRFSARQSAENFNVDTLRETVKKAHFCGVKVYVAMNTIVKDGETEAFLRDLLSVWAVGADAIILQDVFLGKAIKRQYPNIVLHLSTQAGVCTREGAQFAKDCGFSRVILARETPLSEIREISKIIETEAFVQGALCTCFSGQCYFSSFAGGNSGNRGRCKQPCRKQYTYDRDGFEEKAYALSLSDLSVGEDVAKYIAAGVASFKIEGRMRRAEYVAAATAYYRLLVDGEQNARTKAKSLSDLKRTYNRGNYTKGLAFGQDKRFLSTAIQGHIGEKVGVVKAVNGKYLVESTFEPLQGDAFKILRGGAEVGGAVFSKSEKRGFSVLSKTRLKNGDGVFVTTDGEVNARVLNKEKRGVVSLRLHFHEGERAIVESGDIRVYSDEILQSAQSRALTVEELKECFLKTDGLPVEVVFDIVDLQGNIFIPKSALNAIRRTFYEVLAKAVTENGNSALEYAPLKRAECGGDNKKTAVIATDFTGVQTDIAVYKPDNFSAPLPDSFIKGDFEKYLYFPPFCTEKDVRALEAYVKEYPIDGVYAENYGGLVFAQNHGLKIFAGTGLHLINGVSVSEFLKTSGATYYALSKEANEKELDGLLGEKAFVLSSGDIKLMNLCYCPFEKTCGRCDKRGMYALTDENGRVFPVRRYTGADGNCRFEVYNCARLIGTGVDGAGKLLDLTTVDDKGRALAVKEDTDGQKAFYQNYTSGHLKRGVL